MAFFAAMAVVVCAMLGFAPDRPRDPWVFRCVLDENPRMVVIALHEDLWAAYDAATCSLYKVWRGGVKFDGAVYTTVHGPQPTSEGEVLFEGPDGPVWTMHSSISGPPQSRNADVQWRGYRIEDESVWLHYDFAHDGLPHRFEESVEVILEDDRAIGIVRRFRQVGGQPGVPASHWMTLLLADGPQPAMSRLTTNHRDGQSDLRVPSDDPRFTPKITAAGDFEVRMYFQRDEATE